MINVDFAIAITQNFCSLTNFEYVWLKTRFARPKLASKLSRAMSNPPIHLAPTDEIRKKFLRRAKSVKKLETVPALETSSDDSDDSSSSSSSGSDSDLNVVCECHNRKRKQGFGY